MLPSCFTFGRECWETRRCLQSFSIKLCVRYYPYDWCASSTYLKRYFLGIPSQFQALQKAKLRRWDNPKCRRHVFAHRQKLHTNKLKCFYGIKVAPLFLCKSKYESRWYAYWCWNGKKSKRNSISWFGPNNYQTRHSDWWLFTCGSSHNDNNDGKWLVQ